MIVRFWLLLLGLCSAPAFAEIEIQTSINDFYVAGESELLGSITMYVKDDDFADASPENPHFIRIRLASGLVLASTLVDLTQPDRSVGDPVYLAVELITIDPDRRVNVPTDAVSIMRWVAGEPEIWIGVHRSSSTWSRDTGGMLYPAGIDAPLGWTIGISARSSVDDNSDPDHSNLPFNTRNPDALPGEHAFAESTLICADATPATLAIEGPESLAEIEVVTFAADAERAPGVYAPGTETGIEVEEGNIIGRAKGREVEIGYLGRFSASPPERVGDLIRTRSLYYLQILAQRGSNLLDTDLFDGAYWRLTVPDGGVAGFLPGDMADLYVGNTITPRQVRLRPVEETAFVMGDRVLYRSVDVIWEDRAFDLTQFGLYIDVRVHVSRTYFTATPEVREASERFSVDMYLSAHDGPYDGNPYTSEKQYRRCEPSFLYVPLVDPIGLGEILPVAERPLVIQVDDQLAFFFWSDMAALNGFAYGYGNGMVEVIDIADLERPYSVVRTQIGGDADGRFEVAGKWALGEASTGFYPMEISMPGTLEVKDMVETGAPIRDFALDGQRAIVSVLEQSTLVYDLTGGQTAEQITVIEGTGKVSIAGDRLALLDNETVRLYTFDGQSAELGAVFPVADATDLLIVGQTLYVAAVDTLAVYDLSDPDNPLAQPSVAVSGADELSNGGNILSLGSRGTFVDISSPNAPVKIDIPRTFPTGSTVAVSDSDAVIVFTPSGVIDYYDAGDQAAIERRAYWRVGNFYKESLLRSWEEQLAVVHPRGVVHFIRDTGLDFELVGTATIPDMLTSVRDAELRSGLLYHLEDDGRFRVFDIDDPRFPEEILSYSARSDTSAFDLLGNLVLLLDDLAVRILDPGNGFFEIATIPVAEEVEGTTLRANDITVVDHLLYVTADYGLRIYDLTDPSIPVLLTTLTNKWSWSTEIRGNRGLIDGSVLIELSDPSDPVVLARGDDRSRHFALTGDISIGANGAYLCGLIALDFSDPDNPTWSCFLPYGHHSDVLSRETGFLTLRTGTYYGLYSYADPFPVLLSRQSICLDPVYEALPAWPDVSLTDLLARQAAGCDWVE